MYKKLLSIHLLILAFSMGILAKNGRIQGVISDAGTGELIPFANISILKNNQFSSLGTVTDNKGAFSVNQLEYDEYAVVVSFIGFETDTIKGVKLNRQQPVANLGNIRLKVSGIALKELEITAMAATQTTHLDRKTYRAADFETARGGTAVDVLNKLPSISVSADGEVSVRGTTDFMVYLNGKPTQLEPSMLLGQLSSDAIENIDVISVPSAKYDAQGKGGIINITTKTVGLDGLSVAINGTLGGAPWLNTRDVYSNYLNTDNRYTGGVNVMYGKKNLSLYGGLNYGMRNVNGDRTGDARILDKNTGLFKHMIAAGERPEWYENFSANAGFDYRFSKNTQLSASYFYGNRTEGRGAFYLYNIFTADKFQNNKTNESWVYNPNTDTRYGIFHTANVDLKQKLTDQSELTLSFLYEHSNLSRELDNENFNFNKSTNAVGAKTLHFNQKDQTPLDAFRFSIDYARDFDNGSRLSLGFQPQLINIAGNFEYDTLNFVSNQMNAYTALENGVDLTRILYAAYIDYGGSWNKLKYLLGMRFEYTDQTMEIDNPNYFSIFNRPAASTYDVQQPDWFPSMHLAYELNDKNKLNFAANRRISRPAVKDMAPFLYRRHLEVYVVGDPGLKPQYISNVELNYETRLGKQKIGLTGFYRGVDNALFRVNTVYDQEMVLIRSITNSGNTSSTGIEVNANLEAGKRTKFFVGGSVYHFRVQGEAFGYKEDNSSVNWSLKGNANIGLTKELKLTADFDIKSATVTAQGNNFMMYLANAALNYAPAKLNKWNFSLEVLDILNSNVEGLDTRAYNSAATEIFYQKTYYYRTGTIAELGVSYSLNANNQKTKKTESTFGRSEF
ncbi:MAG: TonB-dependent receptor [Paludibacter sp.]|jgi:outer membrane receptor protein involved in Fe transport|nr:TonB-dependent receptor [Paludibacter sp.]